MIGLQCVNYDHIIATECKRIPQTIRKHLVGKRVTRVPRQGVGEMELID